MSCCGYDADPLLVRHDPATVRVIDPRLDPRTDRGDRPGAAFVRYRIGGTFAKNFCLDFPRPCLAFQDFFAFYGCWWQVPLQTNRNGTLPFGLITFRRLRPTMPFWMFRNGLVTMTRAKRWKVRYAT
jgi:hypothetical protein